MGEYGLDIFANAIMRYAHERGQRMRKRAVRDGRRLDHETFLSYGELKSPQVLRTTVLAASPCLYALLPPLHVAGKLGQIWSGTLRRTVLQICRSPSDPGLSSRSGNDHPVGPGTWRQLLHFFLCSDCQTPKSRQRIAAVKKELAGQYTKDFLYHCGHLVNSFHTCISDILGEETASLITRRTACDFDTYTKDGYSKDILAEAQQDFSEI